MEDSAAETYLRPVWDLDAIRQCYDRYGVVGVTGVLNSGECEALAEDLSAFLPDGCSMANADSFDLADGSMSRYGVFPKRTLFSAAVLNARLHPNVVSAYSAVYGTDKIYACHDRAAWMRPALLNPSWDTPYSWPGLHLDVNLPSFHGAHMRSHVDAVLENIDYLQDGWTAENNAKHVSMGRTVQGVLNLFDNKEEDGGFQCVPGMFGETLERWAAVHPNLGPPEVNGRYDFKGFGVDAEVGNLAVRIPCPAGTLILFDSTLPHGTKPNTSLQSRAILFLRYIRAEGLPPRAWSNRNEALRLALRECNFVPDDFQAHHLYGPEDFMSSTSRCNRSSAQARKGRCNLRPR